MQVQSEKTDQTVLSFDTEMLRLQTECTVMMREALKIQKKAFFFQRVAVTMIFIGLVLEICKVV